MGNQKELLVEFTGPSLISYGIRIDKVTVSYRLSCFMNHRQSVVLCNFMAMYIILLWLYAAYVYN